jgi:hypothetical protein
MSMVDEIDEIATFRDTRISKFVSGQDDWYSETRLKDRNELVQRAKTGCPEAIQTLRDKPFNIKHLVIEGQVVIAKEV